MPRHDVNQHATAETRRKGAMKAAEAKRRKREEAEASAAERLFSSVEKALAALEHLLDSEDDHVVFRAVKEVLDRVLGRPTTRVDMDMSWPMTFDPSKLDDEELGLLRNLLEKSQPGGGRKS